MTPLTMLFIPVLNSTNKNLISVIRMNSIFGDSMSVSSTGITAKVGHLSSLCKMVLHEMRFHFVQLTNSYHTGEKGES